MKLVDYAQAIANKVCSFTSQISAINNTLTDHETRLDTLEACVLPCNTEPVQPTVPSSVCILPTQTDIPIVDFAEALELQFCGLKSATGTPTEINTALDVGCANSIGASPSLADSISNPSMSTLSGWTATPDTLAESFGNLWLTVCDLRDAFMNLKTTVAACCGVSCNDNTFSLSGLMTGRLTADITMSGNIDNAFQFCSGTSGIIKVTDPWNTIITITSVQDIINNVNNNIPYDLDFSTGAGVPAAACVVYNVRVEACLTTVDGSVTCSINESTLFQNTFFIETYTKFESSVSGQVELSFYNPKANTTYVFYLKDDATGNILATHNTGLITIPTTVSKTFTGIAPATVVRCSVTATQNLYTINCPDTPTFEIL